MSRRDYWVTVCSVCGRAGCWHGTDLCDEAQGASTVDLRASQLRASNLEHRSNFSIARLTEVCGNVDYVDEVPAS